MPKKEHAEQWKNNEHKFVGHFRAVVLRVFSLNNFSIQEEPKRQNGSGVRRAP